MWSFGYTDPLLDEGAQNVVLGEESTFSAAIRGLHESVLFQLKDAEEYETEAFETLLADISVIMDDPGIMDDPDQWEDEDFFYNLGEFVIEYWIVTD